MFPDLDYTRLKRSFEYFAGHYASAKLDALDSRFGKLLERDEPSQISRANRALAAAIADFIEGTQDFCRERVLEIDRDLQKRDAYTLSFLREHSQKTKRQMFDVASRPRCSLSVFA